MFHVASKYKILNTLILALIFGENLLKRCNMYLISGQRRHDYVFQSNLGKNGINEEEQNESAINQDNSDSSQIQPESVNNAQD